MRQHRPSTALVSYGTFRRKLCKPERLEDRSLLAYCIASSVAPPVNFELLSSASEGSVVAVQFQFMARTNSVFEGPDVGKGTFQERPVAVSTDLARAAWQYVGDGWSPLPGQAGAEGWVAMNVPPTIDKTAFLAQLASDPRVIQVSELGQVGLSGTNQFIPNDSSFSLLYGLHNTGQSSGLVDADIDAAEGWDGFTGSTEVVIAGIDTGIDYDHADLYLNVWINPAEIPASRRANLVDTDSDGKITFWDLNQSINQGLGKIVDLNSDGRISGSDILTQMSLDAFGNDTGLGGWADGISQNGDAYVDDLVGWNFVNGSRFPADDHGHGTHTAGTMGAIGNNGLGVSGVLHKTQIIPVKFLNAAGSGTDLAAAMAIEYAVAMGADVSNNSWGDDSNSALIDQAVDIAEAAGSVFVAAAGNFTRNNDTTPFFPASYPNPTVISVAATDRLDRISGFSNYGLTTVDLAAPGSSIYSTLRNNLYGSLSGTSMAAPHVAATVAAIMAVNPTWTTSQVVAKLLASVDPVASLAGKMVTGGRLNFAKAVDISVNDQPGSGNDLRIVAASISGPLEMTVTYEILGSESSAFELGVYRSVDATPGSDQLVGRFSFSDPGDLTAGLHTRQIPIGNGLSSLPLPGFGNADVDTDYRLLAVVDRLQSVAEDDLNPFMEDNTLAVSGVYQASNGDIHVYGTDDTDSVIIQPEGTTVRVSLNGNERAYSLSNNNVIRVRTAGGNDQVRNQAAYGLRAWAGEGDDEVWSGPVSDVVHGGSGADRWILIGTGQNDSIGLVNESSSVIRATLGTNIDRFTFDANDQVHVLAGFGNDSVTANITIPAILQGEDGNDTLTGGSAADTLLGGLGNDTLNGKLGNDTIDGGNGTDQWNVEGSTSGDVVRFQPQLPLLQLSVLRSATPNGPTLEEDVSQAIERISYTAGNGNDQVDMSAIDAPVYLALGLALLTVDGGNDNDILIGSDGADTLRGSAGNDQVSGGEGNDTLDGGLGNDILDGGGGNDSIAAGGGQDQLFGGTGNDKFTFLTTQAQPTTFDGGTGTDTLTAPTAVTLWNLTGANAGAVNGYGFAQIENLTGSSQPDTLRLLPGGSLTGVFTASSGVNTLDFASYDQAAQVNLATRTSTGVSGFTGVANLIGTSLGADRLIGANATTVWSITGVNSGTAGATTFSGFEQLTGGTGADTFRFQSIGLLTGTVDGGSGTDTLDYSLSQQAIEVNLQLKTSPQLSAFNSFESLIGSTFVDTLTGSDVDTVWTFSNATSGRSGTFSFTAMESLRGGLASDIFRPNANIVFNGLFDGGGGRNTLDYAAYTAGLSVNLLSQTSSAVSGGVANIRDVLGGAADDQLTGDAQDNLLIGNGGNDSLAGGLGNDILMGGSGNDSLSDIGGRNLMIGGAGLDSLFGGVDEDLLIGSATSFDSNTTALTSILLEWQRSDLLYIDRINHLTGAVPGGLNGTATLRTSTVPNDGSVDSLIGQDGLDWFWAAVNVDLLQDLAIGERVN